jgi:hypothetical protein
VRRLTTNSMPPYRCGGNGNQGGAIIPMRMADLQRGVRGCGPLHLTRPAAAVTARRAPCGVG